MRTLILAALLLLVGGVAAVGAAVAPAFTLRLLDARGTFDSRDALEKSVLVVRFQASWCRPCAREAAALERLYERYRGLGVEVIGVQVQDTAVDARRFLRGHGATYPAGLDPHLIVANRFGLRATPYTVVIDREGRVVARIHGESALRRLPRILDPLLQPSTEPPAF